MTEPIVTDPKVLLNPKVTLRWTNLGNGQWYGPTIVKDTE